MQRRSRVILLTVVGIAAFLLWNGAVRSVCSELTYPFRRMGMWMRGEVATRLGAAWRGLCDGPMRLDAENENERLLVMLRMTDAIIEENAELRVALNWKLSQRMQVVAASVWNYGGGLGAWPRLTLNAGSAQGIQPGDAVVVREGLVGRIAPNVAPHTSEVILLSDPACRVAVEIPGRVKGIAQGAQGIDFGEVPEEELLYVAHPLTMRYVGKDTLQAINETVLTEGSGERFPRGLVVGTIMEQRRGENDILAEALIAPAVDPTTLRTVFVLTRASSTETPNGH